MSTSKAPIVPDPEWAHFTGEKWREHERLKYERIDADIRRGATSICHECGRGVGNNSITICHRCERKLEWELKALGFGDWLEGGPK